MWRMENQRLNKINLFLGSLAVEIQLRGVGLRGQSGFSALWLNPFGLEATLFEDKSRGQP